MLNSYCMVTKVPGYLRPAIFSKISIYFRVSVVSEVGTGAPTPLEVTQPQNITELRLFSSWHAKSGHGLLNTRSYMSHLRGQN